MDRDLVEVGRLLRREADQIVVAYSFDLRTRQLETRMIPNPGAGQIHVFTAYRIAGDGVEPVTMRDKRRVLAELPGRGDEDAD